MSSAARRLASGSLRTRPGFFNFVNNDNGVNPAAALHGGGPGLVGEPGLLPGAAFTPGRPPAKPSAFSARASAQPIRLWPREKFRCGPCRSRTARRV